MGDVKAHAAATLPAGARLMPSGYVPLYVRLIDCLVAGQRVSLATTFLVIVVIVGLLLRSLRDALLALPANVLRVAVTLGFTGYAGIDLDASTVLIASSSLGVAVDDPLHSLFELPARAEAAGATPAPSTRPCAPPARPASPRRSSWPWASP